MKRILLFQVFIFCFLLCANAQREITVRNVEGMYTLSQDITPKQAKENALEEAKKNALRQAGITENVSSTSVLASKGSSKEQIEQAFNEFSAVEINGKVIEWEILSEDMYKDNFGNYISKVVINATVVKYKKESDPSFIFKIDGIDEYYMEGSNMNFSFIPFKEGYLKVFYFEGDMQCDMIYPNPYEKNRLFTANDTVKFPISHMIEYEMTTEKEKEFNHVVFVFLKKDFPFTEEVTYKSLLKWLYRISPDQRAVQYFSYMIEGRDE